MDTKAKKRLEVIRPKIQQLKSILKGIKDKPDDPKELQELQRQIADLEAEAERLKLSK